MNKCVHKFRKCEFIYMPTIFTNHIFNFTDRIKRFSMFSPQILNLYGAVNNKTFIFTHPKKKKTSLGVNRTPISPVGRI